jgi:hypothetical protein
MDELEISGKRYISSRRAGKEHKYHPDYIGQLVRAGKVEGQKVGRAWYVDADSLTRYLSQDLGPRDPLPKNDTSAPIVEKIVVEEGTIEPVEKIKIQESIDEHVKGEELKIPEVRLETYVITGAEAEKIPIRTEMHIQKKIGGLTYLSDDAPLFPAIKKNAIPMTKIPVRTQEHTEEYRGSVHVLAANNSRTAHATPIVNVLRAGVMLVVLGCASFIIAAILSDRVIATTIVTQGQTASTEYSLK